jgi:hypothetical protein
LLEKIGGGIITMDRFIYAFFFAVLAVGVAMVADMLIGVGGVRAVMSPYFFVPCVVIGYIFEPRLSKVVRLR